MTDYYSFPGCPDGLSKGEFILMELNLFRLMELAPSFSHSILVFL